MFAKGTKVRKELEFFTIEGWVIGEAQTRRGSRIVVIEVDPETSDSSVVKESQIFCAQPDTLVMVE